MVQALLGERVAQGLDHVTLANHAVKASGTVFAGENH
jgi:hypothetical protein